MKTAVFIRGHARTWRLAKENTINVFRDLYGDVDWYVAFPDTGTTNLDELKRDFDGVGHASIHLLDMSSYPLIQDMDRYKRWATFHTAYWRLAWLDYHLGFAKREKERLSHVIYDNVVFVRPDAWYYVQPEHRPRVVAQLKTMTVAEIGSTGDVEDDWVMGDLAYRAGAAAADLITLRYIDPHYTDGMDGQLVHGNSHSLLAYLVPRRFMGYGYEGAGMQYCIMRPDHVDQLPFNSFKVDPNYRDSRTWPTRSHAEKLEYCARLGISPLDYQL